MNKEKKDWTDSIKIIFLILHMKGNTGKVFKMVTCGVKLRRPQNFEDSFINVPPIRGPPTTSLV